MNIKSIFYLSIKIATLLTIAIVSFHDTSRALTYSDSIHSDSTNGVNRLTEYATGNCAHCHMQHSSLDGDLSGPYDFALFSETATSGTSQTVNMCFECHDGSTVVNESYASNFGGETATASAGIESAFAATNTSYHDLDDVYTAAQTYFTGASGEVPTSANPCGGCHNPHLVQKNNNTVTNYDASKASVSLPTSRISNLWGDDSTERMNSYNVGNVEYRAPFYVGAVKSSPSTLHEPDGSANRPISSNEVKGSITPDYDSFCLTCHQYSFSGGTIEAINFSSTGDKHGLRQNAAGGSQGNRLAPYTVDGSTGTPFTESINYYLSCMDCHEPHGSSNMALLRSTVNGKTGIVVTTGTQMANFCTACHAAGHQAGNDCTGCHNHNQIMGGNKYTF